MWEITKAAHFIRRYGPVKAFRKFFILNDVKAGRKVGQDRYGNNYYENKQEVVWGRDRWVDYAQNHLALDATQIPPEWHAWLHRMTDVPPTSSAAGADLFFYAQRPLSNVLGPVAHTPNYTGTPQAYRPYSTTRPKTEEWIPPS